MMECGCPEGKHTGPGCPVWKGRPHRVIISLIARSVEARGGYLYLVIERQLWKLNSPERYRMLNKILDECRSKEIFGTLPILELE